MLTTWLKNGDTRRKITKCNTLIKKTFQSKIIPQNKNHKKMLKNIFEMILNFYSPKFFLKTSLFISIIIFLYILMVF